MCISPNYMINITASRCGCLFLKVIQFLDWKLHRHMPICVCFPSARCAEWGCFILLGSLLPQKSMYNQLHFQSCSCPNILKSCSCILFGKSLCFSTPHLRSPYDLLVCRLHARTWCAFLEKPLSHTQ